MTASFHHPLIPWMPQVALKFNFITATFPPSRTHRRNALLHGLINGLNGLVYNSRSVSHGLRQPFQLTNTSSSIQQPATRGQQTPSVRNCLDRIKDVKGLIHVIAGWPTFCLWQPGSCLALHRPRPPWLRQVKALCRQEGLLLRFKDKDEADWSFRGQSNKCRSRFL